MAETRYIEGQSRYALSEMIGRGGFATVWRASPVVGGYFGSADDVAIKVIPVYNESERSRALREGQIAEYLKHPNIVETLEVIPGEHEIYLVTEFVAGLPLDEAARFYGVDEVADSLAQVLEALVYAHGQGIIHRDIKPQNALVDRRGTVKLTDFGVAYRAGDTRLTRIGFAVGTPGYIAPEILDGSDPTALTDIYAVGATAKALLSHQPEEPSERLREFIDRATSPNPAHRPQSAWAALKLLTGRKAPRSPAAKPPARASAKKTRQVENRERREKRPMERMPAALSSSAMRAANGLAAGYLGYLLGSSLLLLGGAESAGIAAGFGVAGYLLPRLAALGIIVALAVALLQGGVGLGLGLLAPAVGAVWVVGSGAVGSGARKLPLAPVLAVPLAAVNLAAGLPILLGAVMRPIAAGLSAMFGGFVFLLGAILMGDGVLPFYGGTPFREIPEAYGPGELIAHVERIVVLYPEVLALPVLWGLMAVVVSVGEWAKMPFVGISLAALAGLFAYAAVISGTGEYLADAVISLGLASIIYVALRYLVSWARG
ncbi:MAG: serine/threonine protein kinase [Actinomycetota bacterium]|nr:serine/threonine protein kinase [Actinomycetota bacterium]